MGTKKSIIASFVLSFLMMSFVSGAIMVSQPESVYNFGDELVVEFEIDEYQDGYFDVDLVCIDDNVSIISKMNFFHGVLSEKILQITRELIPLYIGTLRGDCFVEANYGTDLTASQSFEIVDKLIVGLEINQLDYTAGDVVIVKGYADKNDGSFVEGYVDVRLGNDSKSNGIVAGGLFEINFSTLSTMPAGTYPLVVSVYDVDGNGNVLNRGEDRADLIVNQEPAWMEIAIDKQIILPDDELKIIPFLYDRANYLFGNNEILLKIEDSSGNIVFEKLTGSGNETSYTLPSNYSVGYSKITAEVGNITAKKIFDVGEYPKISIETINDKLIITNVGNVRYDKIVEIGVGSETILERVKLEKRESEIYELFAPEGNYKIKVSDEYGSLIYNTDGVMLTGNALGISEEKSGLDIFVRYPLIWLLIIVILAGIGYVLYKNNKKKKEFSFPVHDNKKKHIKQKESEEDSLLGTEKKENKKNLSDVVSGMFKKGNTIKPGVVSMAEHVLVLSGTKQASALVVIKIKNDLSKFAQESLGKMFSKAYEKKGAVSQIDDGFLILFSPAISKSFKNSENAIKFALEIEKELKDYNRKFKNKIEYGISVHEGDMISKIEKNKLKYTSVGSTINMAKKIADVSNEELLISKTAHDKTRSVFKAEPTKTGLKDAKGKDVELFKIKRIVDNEKSKQFVQDFLRKN